MVIYRYGTKKKITLNKSKQFISSHFRCGWISQEKLKYPPKEHLDKKPETLDNDICEVNYWIVELHPEN